MVFEVDPNGVVVYIEYICCFTQLKIGQEVPLPLTQLAAPFVPDGVVA